MPAKPYSSAIVRSMIMIVIATGLACCSTIVRNPVPEGANLPPLLEVPGAVRFWGDRLPRNLKAMVQLRHAQLAAASVLPGKVMNYLVISGGGSNGSFGAGLLTGWSDLGSRPRFDLVTGVSAGALIAPFAFLGRAYDPVLRQLFTRYGQESIARRRPLLSITAAASIADNSPMAALIEHYVTPDVVRAIAYEYRRGRRLLIGTTHLDAQRPVIWDMGAIAARGDAKAVDLFRRVLLASTAIPGIFPPVLMKVVRNGAVYDEMHVDGGVTGQAFIFPAQLDPRALGRRVVQAYKRRIYVIWNGRLNAEWQPVDPSIVKIAGRSISSLIKYEGRGDLDRMYAQSRTFKADFNLAAIPPSFMLKEKEPFDLDYMKALFDYAYQLGRRGYHWLKKPPGASATVAFARQR